MKHTPLTLTDILIAATLSPLSVGAFWQIFDLTIYCC
jgi:hypothetical protein